MYKAEFFDRNFNFQCVHHISEDTLINMDYLVLDTSTLTVKGRTKTAKGSYVHISGIDFDGIVVDVQPAKDTVTISVKPLMSIFEVDVFSGTVTDAAAYLFDEITAYLISNTDTLQNLPIQLTNSAPATGRPLILAEDISRLTDIMATALVTYQIAVDCKLDMNNRQIVAEIKQVSNEKTIEADLDNIIDKQITIGDSYGSCNKAYIRKLSTDNSTGTVSVMDIVPFFLHTDGTVSAQDTDRILPVFWTLDSMENSDDWNRKALAKAAELFASRKYDNEILLTYRSDDRLIFPKNLQIGTIAVIRTESKNYISILTGKAYSAGTIQLIFGAVRVDLTKKIKMDRRNKR